MNTPTKSMHLTSNTAWFMFILLLQQSSKNFGEKPSSNNKHPRHNFKLTAYLNSDGDECVPDARQMHK